MATEIILAQQQGTKFQADPETMVEPGSWWRLVDPENEIASRPVERGMEIPAHGIVLLLAEIHVVDGEIHAVTVHGHPILRMGRIKMLRDEFLNAFSPCPEGEALRAAELATAMCRIQAIGASMSDMPDDQRLLEAFPPKPPASKMDADPLDPNDAAGESAPLRIALPAALLPSGDVVAAQGRIEHGIAVLEARSAWVKAKTEEMTHGMKVVQSYQEERVAQSLAGISEQRKMAEGLLRNVHSMRLFLGEGVEVETVLKGKSAPAAEPLHLMQRMLYLDEEIFVGSMMDKGFTADDMSSLPAILAANPALVTRMLPHPRCVAITRIRRKNREFAAPQDMAQAFMNIQAMMRDEAIQILIRDGENLHMVIADEETSKAKRLFPSRDEINAIFVKKTGYDWSSRKDTTREITPFDVEYSDKRSDHDARALFYRRFLLILWGLQERLGVFGPFIPDGTNWLEETTHQTYFRFIHDEENVLADDLKPVAEWIAGMNAWLRPGSELMVNGLRAMTSDTARPAFRQGTRHYDFHRVRDPVSQVDHLVAARRGTDLVVSLPCKDPYSDRRMNTPVILKGPDGKLICDGILCLDRVGSKTLRRYIESRVMRESYLDWLALFMTALPVIKVRETEAAGIIARLNADHPDLEPHLANAIRMVREAARGRGLEAKDDVKIIRLARLMSTVDPEDLLQDGLQLRLRANCEIVRIHVSRDPLLGPAGIPLLGASIVKPVKGGEIRMVPVAPVGLSVIPDLGEHVLAGHLTEADVEASMARVAPGLRDMAALDALRNLTDPAVVDQARDLLDAASTPSEAWLTHWLAEARRMNVESKLKMVEMPALVLPVAMACFTGRSGKPAAQALRLSVNPVTAAFHAGRADLVRVFSDRIFRNSATGYASLERRYAGRAPIRLEYRSISDERPLAGPEISATGLQFGDWGSFGAEGGCLFQPVKRDQGPVPTTLREAIAINLVRERGHDSFRAFTADDLENLRKTMDDIRIFCAYGMEALIDVQVRNASAVGVAA